MECLIAQGSKDVRIAGLLVRRALPTGPMPREGLQEHWTETVRKLFQKKTNRQQVPELA